MVLEENQHKSLSVYFNKCMVKNLEQFNIQSVTSYLEGGLQKIVFNMFI